MYVFFVLGLAGVLNSAFFDDGTGIISFFSLYVIFLLIIPRI